ncbi:hypothetical protein [Brevundimonas sp.]|uniref:hypothetical protein n=1 Tax=Brevundimonas sp. TaxID=1871086 RepID=UPI002ED84FAE
MNLVGFVTYAVGWLKGGHPERYGVAVLLTGQMIEFFFLEWEIGELEAGIAGSQAVMLLIFGRLALRSNRWWPLAVTGCLALLVMVHLLVIFTPVSFYAAMSARVGLWHLLYLFVLGGVAERWMAGERAASRIGRGRAPESV